MLEMLSLCGIETERHGVRAAQDGVQPYINGDNDVTHLYIFSSFSGANGVPD